VDIRISRLHFPVTALGPGRRIGIWFQGCSIRCPGCISMDTWATRGGATTQARVLDALRAWLPQADGITISGGEPFDQPEALLALLRVLRAHTGGDVLVYSGYPLEAIHDTLEQARGLIDALVSDPFELDAPHTRPLRGSDNQRLHLLTEPGRRHFAGYERPLAQGDRALDVMFDADGSVWFAGIPGRGDFPRLRKLLAARGHALHASLGEARGREGTACPP
jgi:anaerobic ribonucleoside-triphosphate reductase activating protein